MLTDNENPHREPSGDIIPDRVISRLEKENAELKQQLAAFHAAMEREKKPDWQKWLKDLADKLERIGTTSTQEQVILSEAARQLRYMADSFTLKANFVPSELRIKELEQQLARAQAACEDANSQLRELGQWSGKASTVLQQIRHFGVESPELSELLRSPNVKGWHSPQDWERLEAEAAVMRWALGLCKRGTNLSLIEKALSATAGTDLIAKLERYEKALWEIVGYANPYSKEVAREALGEQKL